MATSKIQRRKPGEHPVSSGTDKIVTKSGALGCQPDNHGINVVQAMVIGEAMYHSANFEFRVLYRSVFGAYIDSIDQLSDGDRPNHYWMLYINGSLSSYGASEALVFEDDTTTTAQVDWKYEDVAATRHPQLLGKTKPIPQPS